MADKFDDFTFDTSFDDIVEDEYIKEENKNFETLINDEETSSELEEEQTQEKPKSKRTSKKASKTTTEVDFDNSNNGNNNSGVVTKSVEQVIHESMLPYSEFVIMDRALPRVEDGLKPVQRRVLYSMLEVGVLPDRPFRKSARIVGDCMGKYHPHGDKSIYDTMVRLAQDFNMGEVLVKGHGNFGSVDGDSAAAMRYTEAKLAPIALELLRDIEKDTVSWSFNFDDTCKEPNMLPGRFPNLLVNGGTGIAVGLATNIPTHNLRETINAVCAYIDNKDITLDEIMQYLPGPDFPTGGEILPSSEIKQAYMTGKGKIHIRSKFHIETADNGKKNIVFTEIPFQVNKATLLQRIATVRENDTTGVLSYINEIVDESDRNGTRAVLKLKKDAKIKNILTLLFKNTDLQTNFSVNMVAIADGKPKLLSLMEIISYYVNFQQEVIVRRTKYDLDACLKKEHILEGLLIAINNIDEVVRIIKTSKSVTDAKIQLINRFELSEIQAQAILDMRLARLTNLEVNKLITELNRLKDLIKRYQAILKSPRLQMKIVKQELGEIAKQYGSERKTKFGEVDINLPDDLNSNTDEEEVVENTNIIISPVKTVKNVIQKSYNLATKELSANNATIFEIPEFNINIATNRNIFVFTSLGNMIKIPVEKIEKCKFKDKGLNLSYYYKNIKEDEKVVAVIDFDESNKNDELVFITKFGMIKISKIEEYIASKQQIAAIKLKEGDELIKVDFNKSNSNIALFTNNCYAVIVPKDDIEPSGRVSVGVKGISLGQDDYVVNGIQVSKGDAFTVFCKNGAIKLLRSSLFDISQRNKKGIKIMPTKSKTKLIKVGHLSSKINYVIEKDNGELFYLISSNVPMDTIDGAGKFLKGIKGDNAIKKVYNYVIK